MLFSQAKQRMITLLGYKHTNNIPIEGRTLGKLLKSIKNKINPLKAEKVELLKKEIPNLAFLLTNGSSTKLSGEHTNINIIRQKLVDIVADNKNPNAIRDARSLSNIFFNVNQQTLAAALEQLNTTPAPVVATNDAKKSLSARNVNNPTQKKGISNLKSTYAFQQSHHQNRSISPSDAIELTPLKPTEQFPKTKTDKQSQPKVSQMMGMTAHAKPEIQLFELVGDETTKTKTFKDIQQAYEKVYDRKPKIETHTDATSLPEDIKTSLCKGIRL